jgi:hypothetical protein
MDLQVKENSPQAQMNSSKLGIPLPCTYEYNQSYMKYAATVHFTRGERHEVSTPRVTQKSHGSGARCLSVCIVVIEKGLCRSVKYFYRLCCRFHGLCQILCRKSPVMESLGFFSSNGPVRWNTKSIDFWNSVHGILFVILLILLCANVDTQTSARQCSRTLQ